MKAALFCSEKITQGLKGVLQQQGMEVLELETPELLPQVEAEIVVVQFPVGKYKRGDVFVNLERLWDRSSPITLIIKPPGEKIRRRDLKANVLVLDETAGVEEMGRRLLEFLHDPELLLSKGLEAYAERNYPLAYEYWLRLARSEEGKGTKVFEYLKIAKREFEEAGLDTAPIEKILMERVDPFKEGARLYSEGKLQEALEYLERISQDHPEFVRARALVENIKEELELEDAEEVLNEIENPSISDEDVFLPVGGLSQAELTPKEAFLLSLIDGEATVEKISKIAPMDQEELKNSLKKLLALGLIRRKG